MNLKSKLPKRIQKYASFGIFPKIILTPFAILTVAVFIALRPFVKVQVYKVHDWRIGHFATNTELRRLADLSHNANQNMKHLTIYYFGSKTSSNQFLTRFWKRILPSVSGHWGWMLNEISSKTSNHNSTSSSTNIDLESLLSNSTIPNFFSDDEQIEGNNFIEKHCSQSKFVCLNVRDSEYLNQIRGRNFDHHNYRDSDIKSYIAAAETLAEMGYTVFRMGAIVKEPLVSKHPRVIDYATNGMRSEFLDVYLGAHCTFAVSVGSGWDGIPTIFRRPMIWVNHLPIFDASGLTLPINIFPKKLVNKNSRSLITLSDAIDKNIYDQLRTQAYLDAEVEIRDLTSEELVEAVTEMAQRVEGTFVETPEQKEMQAKLKHILSTHPKLQPSPNYYPIRAQFASCFLSRYPNFLDGLD